METRTQVQCCEVEGCHQHYNLKYAPIIRALRKAGVEIEEFSCPIHVQEGLARFKIMKQDEAREDARQVGDKHRATRVEAVRKEKEIPQSVKSFLTKTEAADILHLYSTDITELQKHGFLSWSEDPTGKQRISKTSISRFATEVVSDPDLEGDQFEGIFAPLHRKLIRRATYFAKLIASGVLD